MTLLREFIEIALSEGCELDEIPIVGPRGPTAVRFLIRSIDGSEVTVTLEEDLEEEVPAASLRTYCGTMRIPVERFGLIPVVE